MKIILLLFLTAVSLAALPTKAWSQATNNPPEEINDPSAPPPDEGAPPPEGIAPDTGATNGVSLMPVPPDGGGLTTNQPVTSTVIVPTKNPSEPVTSQFVPPTEPVGTNSNELRMNFRNAPLDMVLNYLSDAAGFIIVLETHVSGNVTIVSSHPVSKDEAVDLLNSQLNRNNYAAIRDGRMLTIVDKSDAKTRNIPVKTGNVPANIPKNDEIVTQIIPIRFVEARQLVSDLSLFVSPQATVVANETGNAIIVTDTQANIRHLAEIIKAVDDSAEAETEIRVFRLKYASPADVASELTSVFPNSTSGNSTQSPISFRGGGPGGFMARMMAGAGGGNNAANDRVKKATQVTAVADPRIQAVIVTAPKDLMVQIAGMMADLDVPSERDQGVYVFQMMNGDPQQAVQVLQNMFQSSGTTRSGSSSSTQNSALQQRAQNATTTMGNTTTTSGIGGTAAGAGGGGGRQF